MSGLGSDFTLAGGAPVYEGIDASYLWSHPHFPHVWPGGIVMFDNGEHSDPQVSSVAEFSWNEADRVVEEVWRYPDPAGGYTFSLGDAHNLSTGNVLASWMALARLSEISPDGEVLWEADTGGALVRRVALIEDLYDTTLTGQRR